MVRIILCLMIAGLSLVACGDDESDNFISAKDRYENGSSDGSNVLGSSSSENLSSSDEGSEDSSSSNGDSSSSYDGSSDSNENSADSNSSSSNSKEDDSSSSVNQAFQDMLDSIKLDYNEVYGTSIAFDTIYDSEADYKYKTVQIGPYVWLAENLRQKVMINSKCYNDNQSYCNAFGRMYKDDSPNCPSGFQIPTKNHWESLFQTSKGTLALRSKAVWETGGDKSLEGTNELGFSILPSGICTKDNCSDVFKKTNFLVAGKAGYYTISYDKNEPQFHEGFDTDLYYSVRCVKNAKVVTSKEDLPEVCQKGERYSISEGESYVCYKYSKWIREISESWNCDDTQEGRLGYYYQDDVVYACRFGLWDKASDKDILERVCVPSTVGDTLTFDEYPYVCRGSTWFSAMITDYYGGCNDYENTEIFPFGKKRYICMDYLWRELNAQDSAFGLCTRERFGELKAAEVTYVCKAHKWTIATEGDYLGTCNEENILELKAKNGKRYVCKFQVWEPPTELEERYGLCTEDRFGEVIDSTTNFICKDYDWATTTQEEVLGTCSEDNNLTSKKWKTLTYVCRNSQWQLATTLEEKYGVCTTAKEGEITSDRLYVCNSLKWVNSNAEQFYGPCTEELQYTIFDREYVELEMCEDGAWRKKNTNEKITDKFCYPDREGNDQHIRGAVGTSIYICHKSEWVSVGVVEWLLGICEPETKGKEGVYKDTIYVCNGSTYRNTKVNSILGECTPDRYGTEMEYKNNTYLCKRGEWILQEEAAEEKNGEN